jgi:mannitol/fructose-specific phosphotransferase system IIA component (Ntr-type)
MIMTKKRTVNIINASTTPREKFMSIMIMLNQEKNHQHMKCINNIKRRAHEHHNHNQLERETSTQEMHQQHQEKNL